MLRTGKLLALIFVAFAIPLQAQAGADEVDADIPPQIHDKYLVILCAERGFDSVKDDAEKVSIASGVQFSMNGRVWDSRRGLILPDECGDPIYCGEYLPRRYNELHLTTTDPAGYISVEKSEDIRLCKKAITSPSRRSVTRMKTQRRNY